MCVWRNIYNITSAKHYRIHPIRIPIQEISIRNNYLASYRKFIYLLEIGPIKFLY